MAQLIRHVIVVLTCELLMLILECVSSLTAWVHPPDGEAMVNVDSVWCSLKPQASTFLAPGTCFLEDDFFMDWVGGWFQDDSSTLHLSCTLFLLLLHQLHLRSSGIRSRRLGTLFYGFISLPISLQSIPFNDFSKKWIWNRCIKGLDWALILYFVLCLLLP